MISKINNRIRCELSIIIDFTLSAIDLLSLAYLITIYRNKTNKRYKQAHKNHQ